MKTVEITGKTIDEAVEKGLEELGIGRDNAEIEVLCEPSNGLFGFIGSRSAKVKIGIKREPAELARYFIEQMVEKIGLENVQVKIEKENDNIIFIDIVGENLGVLIGKRGQTLNSIQYLTNLVVNKNFKKFSRVVVDVEGYRQRREGTLKNLAENLAQKVIRGKRNIVLEPMIPQERRIIHTALQNHPSVATYSQGDEPYRKVVITLKKGEENNH